MSSVSTGSRVGLLIVAIGVPASSAAAQHPSMARADSIITHYVDSVGTPGLTVAVARGGQVVYGAAFGYRDLEDLVRADTATLFRIASVTKPITATLILRLVETGQLALDAPITRYCAHYPERRWPVTVRHLLSHTGGVPDYASIERGAWWFKTPEGRVEGSNPFHYHELAEAVRVFADDTLRFEPGTRFQYTNVGFLLLGCAVEGATGRRYADVLRELILDPADMRRTQPNDLWTIIPNRAEVYQGRQARNAGWWWWTRGQKAELQVDTLYNARFEDSSIKLSAGGLLATASDLVRLGAALMGGRVLRPATRDTMWTPQLTSAGDSTGWAMGWVPGMDQGRRTIGLSGGQVGVSAVLRVFRDDDLAVAVIANRDLVELQPLVSTLARLWLGAPATR